MNNYQKRILEKLSAASKEKVYTIKGNVKEYFGEDWDEMRDNEGEDFADAIVCLEDIQEFGGTEKSFTKKNVEDMIAGMDGKWEGSADQMIKWLDKDCGMIAKVSTSERQDNIALNENKLRKMCKEYLDTDADWYASNGADSVSDVAYFFSWEYCTEMDDLGDYLLDLSSDGRRRAKEIIKEYKKEAVENFKQLLKDFDEDDD